MSVSVSVSVALCLPWMLVPVEVAEIAEKLSVESSSRISLYDSSLPLTYLLLIIALTTCSALYLLFFLRCFTTQFLGFNLD